jgi:hypothetical protein
MGNATSPRIELAPAITLRPKYSVRMKTPTKKKMLSKIPEFNYRHKDFIKSKVSYLAISWEA